VVFKDGAWKRIDGLDEASSRKLTFYHYGLDVQPLE
jgi:hypothetical protein